MKLSFPSFIDIEDLEERKDGLSYKKDSRDPYSGIAFFTEHREVHYYVARDSEFGAVNEVEIYLEGLLMAWSNFFDEEVNISDFTCPFIHGYLAGENWDDIIFFEENDDYWTCFFESCGWKVKKDYSNIEIYFRFPSFNEINLKDFNRGYFDFYPAVIDGLEREKKEEFQKNNELKKTLYVEAMEVSSIFCKKNSLNINIELFEERQKYLNKYFDQAISDKKKTESQTYEQIREQINDQIKDLLNDQIANRFGTCWKNNKFFLKREIQLKGLSKMYFKDFIRLYGVKNIGIGGWDYRSSPIRVFEWDLNYLGLELEDRGFFKHIG